MAGPAGAAAETAKDASGALPQWDLRDLYPGRDSPELEARHRARRGGGAGIPHAL